MKKLTRSRNRILLGICGGIADYMDIDPAVIRLITLVLGMFFPLMIFVYLLSALIIPNN